MSAERASVRPGRGVRADRADRADCADRAVLLDALGTIVALQPPAPRLREILRRRFGLRISASQASAAIAAEISYYRGHIDEGRDERSLAALRSRCASALRAALPSSEQLAAVAPEALTEALLASLQFTTFADVIPALGAARARGERLVVVSNWDVSLAGVLAELGLAGLLDGVVTSAAAGARKPATAIFEQALRIAGVSRRDAIHIGDSMEEDIAGARRAGIEPVLIRRDGTPGPPSVRTITTLTELLVGNCSGEP